MSDEEIEWYSPEDPTPRHRCPCCDYMSLSERGNYVICSVCFWEDDGLDHDQIDIGSGPNHGITLRQGRENFQKFGACEKDMVKHVCTETERAKFEFRPHSTN